MSRSRCPRGICPGGKCPAGKYLGGYRMTKIVKILAVSMLQSVSLFGI